MLTPPSTETPHSTFASDLGLIRDIVARPRQAFARIAAGGGDARTAYLAYVVASAIVLWLTWPALAHVTTIGTTVSDPNGAQSARDDQLVGQLLALVAAPALTWSISAMIFAMMAPIPERPATESFRRYLTLCSFAWIPSLGGAFVGALIVHHRGPADFASIAQINLAFPDNLAALVPNATDTAGAFLSFWDPFVLWSLALIGFGIAALAKVEPWVGLALSLAIGLGLALFGAVA